MNLRTSDTPNELFIRLLKKKDFATATSQLLAASGLTGEIDSLPIPIERITADLGIDIVQRNIAAAGILESAEKGFRVVVSREADSFSQRLTIGHELGHWVLQN